jgi:hypothetical protein
MSFFLVHIIWHDQWDGKSHWRVAFSFILELNVWRGLCRNLLVSLLLEDFHVENKNIPNDSPFSFTKKFLLWKKRNSFWKFQHFLKNNIYNIYNIFSHLSKACSKKLFSFSLQEALDFGNGQNLLGRVGMDV